jgi:hypothetical protein
LLVRFLVPILVGAALVLTLGAGSASAMHNPNPKLKVTFSGTWKLSDSLSSGASFYNESGKWTFKWAPRLHDFRNFGKHPKPQSYFGNTFASGSGTGVFQDYGGATCNVKLDLPTHHGLFGLSLVKRHRDKLTVQAAAPFGGGVGSIGSSYQVAPGCTGLRPMVFQGGIGTPDWTPRFAEIPEPRGMTLTENAWNMNVHAASAVFVVNALAPEKTYSANFKYDATSGSGDSVNETHESWTGKVKIAVG